MRFRTRWPAAALAVVVLATAGSAAAWAATVEGSFERTLTVTGPVELDAKTGSGSISVRTGEAGTVYVRATIKARSGWLEGSRDAEERVRALEQNPPIEQEGNTIRIGHIEDCDLRRNISISYEIVVPVETELRSATGSGSQTIDGVRGPVRAATGSGGIRATGDWKLRAGSSGITVRLSSEAAFDLYARTSSGSISTDHPLTVQGTIKRRELRGKVRGGGYLVDMRTGSGSIHIE